MPNYTVTTIAASTSDLQSKSPKKWGNNLASKQVMHVIHALVDIRERVCISFTVIQ